MIQYECVEDQSGLHGRVGVYRSMGEIMSSGRGLRFEVNFVEGVGHYKQPDSP